MTRGARLVMALVLAGCGGGDGSLGDSECELVASVSGQVEWTSSSAPACAIPFGGDEGIWMVFVPVDGTLDAFDVRVEEVMAGEVGDFPAVVDVKAEGDRRWQSAACTVSIESHEFVEDTEFASVYLATGTGECSAPATAVGEGAEGELTVAPFAFRFPAHW